MAEENAHVQNLIAARGRQVEERRELAAVLAQKYERGTTAYNRDLFAMIQNSIEAIERAIWHEKMMESGMPMPYVSPIFFGSADPGRFDHPGG